MKFSLKYLILFNVRNESESTIGYSALLLTTFVTF